MLTHTHTHVSDEGIDTAMKNSSEIIIKLARPEGGFKSGGRIRVVECLRQKKIQTDGPAYENDLSPNVLMFTRGVTKVRVSDADRNCLAGA